VRNPAIAINQVGQTEASGFGRSPLAIRWVQTHGKRLHRNRDRREHFESQDSLIGIVCPSQPWHPRLL